jgi:hypothetical protein
MLAATVSLLFFAAVSDPLAERLLSFPAFPPAADNVQAERVSENLTGDEPAGHLSTVAMSLPKLITPAVRTRVVQRLAGEPDILPEVIQILPDSTEAAEVAWAAFGKAAVTERNGEGYEAVREWLRRHGYLRSDLLTAVKNVHDDDEGGYVANAEDLEAFARLDFESAAPLLHRLARGDAQRTAALAHALLYRYGDSKDGERAILKSIAENQKAPARAREIAIDALMDSDWNGRDDWYFARFEDATLADARDGIYGLSPLDAPVDANPDAWIPRIAPLAKSPSKAVRTNVAAILGEFYLDQARADALRPLLPWLADPEWADDESMLRLRLVQTVARLGLREAIPALQWICGHDEDEDLRVYAADALVAFHAPEAMTYARKALEQTKSFGARSGLEQSIVRENLMTDDEIAELVMAYAAEISSPERARKFEESIVGENDNWRATLGMRFVQKLPEHEGLAQRLITASSQTGPTAAVVGRIVSTMNTPIVHRWVASRLSSLTADDVLLSVSLLEHRTDAAKNASTELHAALATTGAARGIAAIALDDADAIHDVLENGSPEARQGLFAAARLVREPLKIHDVVAASKGAESAAAALLEVLNTSESRAALASLRPGEAVIWGERPWEDPGHTTFAYFDGWEEQLRALAKKRTYERIYALSVASYWGGNHEIALLGERGDALLLIRDGNTKKLEPAVAARVRTLLAEVKPDDLPFYETGIADGAQFEFVSLTADGGHRLFMNNPPSDKGDPYGRLVGELSELFEQKP